VIELATTIASWILFLAIGMALQRARAVACLRLAQSLHHALKLGAAREQELLRIIQAQRAVVLEFAVPPRIETEEQANERRELWAEAWSAAHDAEPPQPSGEAAEC
jgi:hypothetical protein